MIPRGNFEEKFKDTYSDHIITKFQLVELLKCENYSVTFHVAKVKH